MKLCSLLVATGLLALACPAVATVVNVNWDGSGDYQAIQNGIDAASEGDTVLVAAGEYSGSGNRGLTLGGINRVIMSESGYQSTLINCGGLDCGFFLNNSGEDSTTIIDGFTIINGVGQSNGGGILCSDSTPKILNCEFYDCTASNGGAIGVASTDGHLLISNCVIHDCTADNRAGGISFNNVDGPSVIRGCAVYDNTAVSYPGGGIFLNGVVDVTIENCTIVRNTGAFYSGAIYLESSFDHSTLLKNSVVALNSGTPATGFSLDSTHNIVYQNADGDSLPGTHTVNLFTNPLFCDVDLDDFTVCADSPCLPTVNDWDELVGVYDSGCPGCDSPVEESSWGAVKALFR
jgi:hypothetical protein